MGPERLLTLVFTDIEGSTRLLLRLRDDDYADVLSQQHRLLADAFRDCGGEEIDTRGDGYFWVFTDATKAVAAAARAQSSLAGHEWPEGVRMAVRTGIHTGTPLWTAEGYVGLDVHRAARISEACHGGQVLISQRTAGLVGSALPVGASLRDMGAHMLKDLIEPEQLYQLVMEGLESEFPPVRSLPRQATTLPAQPSPIIGREAETAALRHLLKGGARIVTLTGPGGVGKTRLACHIAESLVASYPGGIFFVPMQGVREASLVDDAIAGVLGLRDSSGRPGTQRLGEVFGRGRVLLVVDNFEQVARGGQRLAALAAEHGQLTLLVTSRSPLHVRGEQEFPVPPLALPGTDEPLTVAGLQRYAAAALFLERARAVRPGFEPNEGGARAIAEICQRLDGLPLAIELAAARSKLFTPQAILPRLQHRMDFLVGGPADLPQRQQTMRDAIDWSYRLLSPPQQAALRRLSVFAGSCSLEAAEDVIAAVGSVGEETLDAVAALLDNSFIRQDTDEDGEVRLRMLETIREYAREKLEAAGESDAAVDAFVLYFAGLCQRAEIRLSRRDQLVQVQALELDLDNIRSALGICLEDPERAVIGLNMAADVHRFWWHRHLFEGRAWMERLLAASPSADPRIRAEALLALASLRFYSGSLAEVTSAAEECLALCEGMPRSEVMRGMAFGLVAVAAASGGDMVLGTEAAERSVALLREAGRSWSLAVSLGWRGAVAMWSGDAETAKLAWEESIKVFREIGDRWLIAAPIAGLGQIAAARRDFVAARQHLEEGLAVWQAAGSGSGTARALANLGRVVIETGPADEARRYIAESLRIARSLGGGVEALAGLEVVAVWHANEGHAGLAATLFGAAQSLSTLSGHPLERDHRATHERALAKVREGLADAPFEAAWARGQAMAAPEAIDLALA